MYAKHYTYRIRLKQKGHRESAQLRNKYFEKNKEERVKLMQSPAGNTAILKGRECWAMFGFPMDVPLDCAKASGGYHNSTARVPCTERTLFFALLLIPATKHYTIY